MGREGLAIPWRPIIHISNEHQTPIVCQALRRNPNIARNQRRPGCVYVAAMIVVTDNVPIFLLVKGSLGLLANEVIRKAWTMDHLLGAKILDEIIAGDGADDWQMVVVFCFRLVGRTARNELLMLVSIQVNRENELALAVLAIDPPRPFFGSDQRRQKQRGKDRDNSNHYQKFD